MRSVRWLGHRLLIVGCVLFLILSLLGSDARARPREAKQDDRSLDRRGGLEDWPALIEEPSETGTGSTPSSG